MPSRRYRSQPTLQRTSGWSRPPTLGLWLAAIVVGSALASMLARAPSPDETPVAPPLSPAPIAPPRAAMEPATPVPAPQPASAPAASEPQSQAPVVEIARRRVTAPRPAKLVIASTAKTLAARQAAWEKQRQSYDVARAAYDANERTAGYRWAQQNAITISSYCSVAAQRTPAFEQGCRSYAEQMAYGAKRRQS